jgi:hypothetical protein
MTAPPISKHTDYEGGAELRNPTIAAGDDTLVYAGKISYKNARLRVANGTVHAELATVEDVLSASNFRGGFSAAAGSLPVTGPSPIVATVTERPTAAILPGHFVLVTVGGTISGIDGADTLAGGDLLFYLGGGASTASNWHGISRGLDLSPFVISATVTLGSLPDNKATLVPPPASIKTVTSFVLTLGGKVCNGCFEEDFATTGASAGVTLTSLVAKSNIGCVYTGLTV